MRGPLHGIRIIELAGLGPAPFCGMMLADHGAEVIRIDRIGAEPASDPLSRSRRSISINLKHPEGVELVCRLAKSAHGLIEGFRPRVMERLGLGPDVLLKDNPKLVYGRMTGWGQSGPLARAAGHDINYIALSGALHTCGRAHEKPTPPVNYLGDFGGGGMLLAFGMVSALLAVKNGADGQVIDCAMTDGAALLMAMTWGLYAEGAWQDERGVNLLDTGAHFYDTYETKDGKWVAIGSIEPEFYALLREKTGLLEDAEFNDQNDRMAWPSLKEKLRRLFLMRTRQDWCDLMEGTDVCFAPVLSLAEAPHHAHYKERGTYLEIGGAIQPAPAPRYSKTPTSVPRSTQRGADTEVLLRRIGCDAKEIAEFYSKGVVA